MGFKKIRLFSTQVKMKVSLVGIELVCLGKIGQAENVVLIDSLWPED